MHRLLSTFVFVIGLATATTVQSYELNPDVTFTANVIAITDGVPMPETVITLTGEKTTGLEAWDGKVRVVTMWATWCEVCEVEMPLLADLAGRYAGRDLVVLPISVDEPPAIELVSAHLAKHGLAQLPVMHDRNFALAGQIGLRGTPTTLIIDRYRQVVAAFEGQAPWNDPAMDAYLEALLAAPDAEASRMILAN